MEFYYAFNNIISVFIKAEVLGRKLKERKVKSKEQWLNVCKTKVGMQKAFNTQILHLAKKKKFFTKIYG